MEQVGNGISRRCEKHQAFHVDYMPIISCGAFCGYDELLCVKEREDMTIDRNVKNEFQKWAESSVGKDCHYEDWHSGARIRVFPQIKGIEYQLWRCYGEYVGLAINLQNVEDRKAIRTAIDNEKLI